MDARIEKALKSYTTAEVPSKEDLDAIRGLITEALRETGVSYRDAFVLLHVVESGSWNDGWNTGYASGLRRGTPRFNLNGSK